MTILSFRSRRRLEVLLACVGVLVAACSNAPTAPQFGSIRVTVETSGGDPDIDGYEFLVDSSHRYLLATESVIGPDGTRRVHSAVGDLEPGAHQVKLEAVAENCTVLDSDSRSITLIAGQVATVAFMVVCAATGVAITTHTTGPDTPPIYDLVVDQAWSTIAPNTTQIVSRLRSGAHTISLHIRTENCSVVGESETTLTLTAGTITPVPIEIACVPVVRSAKIAYVIDTIVNGKVERWIGVVNPDGSGARGLLPGDSPSWSPNGTALAFSTASCSSLDEYYGFECKGGLVAIDPETLNPILPLEGSSGFDPAWAPTGDVIAFTRCCSYTDQKRLYLARVDGSATVQSDIVGVLSIRHPTWSPDGRQIALTCFINRSTDVCLVNRDGSGLVRLTNDDVAQSGPAWSPDGSKIAVTQTLPQSESKILLVASDGSGITQLTDGFDPAWSRDGTTLVFGRADGLFTIHVDGSHLTRLTKGAHSAPAWRP